MATKKKEQRGRQAVKEEQNPPTPNSSSSHCPPGARCVTKASVGTAAPQDLTLRESKPFLIYSQSSGNPLLTRPTQEAAPGVTNFRVGMEEQPPGKHDPGKSCWMGLGLSPPQGTGTPEQRVCAPHTKPSQGKPLSKPRGFSPSKQRCSVILNSSISIKKCQAAEIAQEFQPAALKKINNNKKPLSNEKCFCRQNVISDTAGTKPAAINGLKDAPSVVIVINFKFKLGD